jgi:transcriptional regulator with XRE-family HTH domain
MVTKFGIQLRKIRLDNGEKLSDMAKRLGISVSSLSTVETGKVPITNKIIDGVIDNYDLDEYTKNALISTFISSVKRLKINLRNATESQKKLMFSFIEKFDTLTIEDFKKIKVVMDEARARRAREAKETNKEQETHNH